MRSVVSYCSRIKLLCMMVVLLLCPIGVVAQEGALYSQPTTSDSGITTGDTIPAEDVDKNIFEQFIGQLIGGNKDRTFERAIDFSFAIAPSYSREASFGLGGMVTGLYRIDRTDSLMPPSDIQLFGNISLTGQYSLILKGNNLFKTNRSRLTYDLAFQNKPLEFWGISYDACDVNPKTHYTRQHIKLESDYVYKITPQIHIGAALNMRYTYLPTIDDIAYLQGQEPSYFLTGVGASIMYDSRDFIPNPKRGLFIMLKEVVYPKWLGNWGGNVFSTTFIADYYQPLWRGSTLAIDLYGQYNGEDVPWPLRPEVGAGGMRMRGYYGGRYIDNNMMSAQIELRQNIYKRWGVVAWVGCGTVFPSFKELKSTDLLINYGVGLRFEFKHNVNMRVDYGFGRNTGGIVFAISEAF